jgi:hypothetical protein
MGPVTIVTGMRLAVWDDNEWIHRNLLVIHLLFFLSHPGKNRRVTFIEVQNDLNSMIDAAKVADLVLLLIDASYGFEMVCNLSVFRRLSFLFLKDG